MPLTFSHPAIILPAKYLPPKWVSMTGLIVGSVTPDFEYFVRMQEESAYTHTWAGMFWLDLPLAILITFIYHYIVRNGFVCNSPAFLRKRLSRYLNFNWGHYFKHHFLTVVICILVGIASHLFWDSFTHPNGDFVKRIFFLREYTDVAGFPVQNSRILQTISTIAGAIVVFYAIMRMPEDIHYAGLASPVDYWLILTGMGVVAINVRIIMNMYDFHFGDMALSFFTGTIAGSMIAPSFSKYPFS